MGLVGHWYGSRFSVLSPTVWFAGLLCLAVGTPDPRSAKARKSIAVSDDVPSRHNPLTDRCFYASLSRKGWFRRTVRPTNTG